MASPSSSPSFLGLSSTAIAAIAFVSAAALVLVVVATIVFVRRHKNRDAKDEEKASGMHSKISLPIPQDTTAPNARMVRSVSKRNLTPSIILPMPVPPIPAARPRPPKVSQDPAMHPSGRPMSTDELLAHYQTAGTMPRPFSPHAFTQAPAPTADVQAPRLSHNSTSFSFSCASIVSASHRNSLALSFRSSLASSGGREGSELLKVRHVFAPLLPDELVLRPNERVTLLQSFEDGWCIVGRRSPFHAPAPGKPTEYAFGQGTAAPEVEIGAVPLWVFEKRPNVCPKPERPMRTESLGVTLIDQDKIGESRDDVISWSNF